MKNEQILVRGIKIWGGSIIALTLYILVFLHSVWMSGQKWEILLCSFSFGCFSARAFHTLWKKLWSDYKAIQETKKIEIMMLWE